jgi:ubiquinone/menaquinone biosynthesis C-methylase UbiE
VVDIGCGRGTTGVHLTARLHPVRFLLLDRSPALLATAADRLHHAHGTPGPCSVSAVCADFHHLPLTARSIHLAVAAFCLYHSPNPASVVAQIATALAPGGHVVLATKSQSSYRELDEFVAQCGLDPHATTRASLYATFHSANAPTIAGEHLDILDVVDEQHVFTFTSHAHIGAYLATTPKYRLPPGLDTPEDLAQVLTRRGAARELTMTSQVTYILARSRT